MVPYQNALIYVMVLVSAADRNMTDAELQTIGKVVGQLPVFADFDPDTLPDAARECAEILSRERGLEQALDIILASLPENLRETAYAVGCEVAAADRRVAIEEVRMLQMLRGRLEIDTLVAAAIERGARARHQVF